MVILSTFSLPSSKMREEEKENELAKQVLNKFFSDPDFHFLDFSTTVNHKMSRN